MAADELEREELMEQLKIDVAFLKTKYGSYLPMEATRALDSVTRLCIALVKAAKLPKDKPHAR